MSYEAIFEAADGFRMERAGRDRVTIQKWLLDMIATFPDPEYAALWQFSKEKDTLLFEEVGR
jgi:hypothetical protein